MAGQSESVGDVSGRAAPVVGRSIRMMARQWSRFEQRVGCQWRLNCSECLPSTKTGCNPPYSLPTVVKTSPACYPVPITYPPVSITFLEASSGQSFLLQPFLYLCSITRRFGFPYRSITFNYYTFSFIPPTRPLFPSFITFLFYYAIKLLNLLHSQYSPTALFPFPSPSQLFEHHVQGLIEKKEKKVG